MMVVLEEESGPEFKSDLDFEIGDGDVSNGVVRESPDRKS